MGQEFQAEKLGVQRQRNVGLDCAEKGCRGQQREVEG